MCLFYEKGLNIIFFTTYIYKWRKDMEAKCASIFFEITTEHMFAK